MTTAAKGNRVKVAYRATLPKLEFDGTQSKTAEFIVGENSVLRGIDEAVEGMEKGQSRTMIIPAAKAFGHRMKNRIANIRKTQLPQNVKCAKGARFTMRTQSGEIRPVTIAEISGDTILLDTNHPWAGRTLKFEVELLDISESTIAE